MITENNIEIFLKIVKRMEHNEIKRELQRLFLVLSFAGILGIMISILEYIFYKNYGEDIIFFILFLSENPNVYRTDLFLAIGISSIYLSTFVVMIIFSLGKSGLIDWNRIYRYLTGALFLIFLSGTIAVILFGRAGGPKLIIIIWGSMISSALIISIYVFKKKLGVPVLINALTIFLIFSLLVPVLLIVFVDDFINIVLYFFLIGIFLVLYSCLVVLFVFRLPPTYNFNHKSDLYDLEFQNNLSKDELNVYLRKGIDKVSVQLEENLGIDQDEFYSYLMDLKVIQAEVS